MMQTINATRALPIALLAALLGMGLAGCGARSSDVPAPAGMKVGSPLTDAQAQALEQKRQSRRQSPTGP